MWQNSIQNLKSQELTIPEIICGCSCFGLGKLLIESCQYYIPHLNLAPSLRVTYSNFQHIALDQKATVSLLLFGLSYVQQFR